ncbi:outer membrane lipoprotein carrier protein LolA [Sphingobacteriales bacterium UPWRP_1]|nr:hypothetical protein B6N25_09315 [Sphingobacteriales bacterium TSM_CSS]PSJ77481.1 outer membrane lipoprotein carrier protein LolA [Sphingobacteriales bacterium UPWRP_1]
MKKAVALLICLLTMLQPLATYAQNDALDPQAKSILDKVARQYKSFKSVKAEFSLRITNPDAKVNEAQSGKLFLSNDKYKVETADFERYCDGASVWTFFKQEREVQINEVDPESGEISPAQLFNINSKDYKYTMRNGSVDTKGNTEIDLTPLNRNIAFYKIRLTVNTKTNLIKKAVVFEKNGTRYTYEILNQTGAQPLESKFFIFDSAKHPGVEVVDLR